MYHLLKHSVKATHGNSSHKSVRVMFAISSFCHMHGHKVHGVRSYTEAIFRPLSAIQVGTRSRLIRTSSVRGYSGEENKSEFHDTNHRYNEIGIQMLSNNLHNQLFKSRPKMLNPENKRKVKTHLEKNRLWGRDTSTIPNVNMKIPALIGNNIDEHFRSVAKSQIAPYVEKADVLSKCNLPEKPKQWVFSSGWTRYCAMTGETKTVPAPECDLIVFDVEVLMHEGQYPTLATAASPNAWYSWCSKRLTNYKESQHSNEIFTDDLIPLEASNHNSTPVGDLARLVIGHNVAFDRSFVKEQYYIEGTPLRFLDTMSMHIAIAGLTSAQRMLFLAKANQKKRGITSSSDSDAGFLWAKQSTMNNLKDVYQYYCGGSLDKAIRDVFVQGKMSDVHQNFQMLMTYCSGDVEATHGVFKKLWPEFCKRFPHPVTLAGMMEMGTAYLPVTDSWPRYITSADNCYNKLQAQLKQQLQDLANYACLKCEDQSYKDDVWLWNLDWTEKDLPGKRKNKKTKDQAVELAEKYENAIPEPLRHLKKFPKWFVELWPRPAELSPSCPPGPSKLSAQRRITPKLLRLMWDGFPLHYDATYGWGYLVPHYEQTHTDIELQNQEEVLGVTPESTPSFPVQALYDVCKPTLRQRVEKSKFFSETARERILGELESRMDPGTMGQLWAVLKKEDSKGENTYCEESKKSGPFVLPYLTGCLFYKLPHKDGPNNRVGNPLSRGFQSFIDDKTLESWGSEAADTVLRLGKLCSYWKNNRDRITSQMVVTLGEDQLSPRTTHHVNYDSKALYAAILPRVVMAGTVTRRAVEPTWLTASNAYEDRIGSELKAMIQCPPGYHFVGADVDAQELWIAAVLGDAHFAGVHGCTALGWMTLQGNKLDGTDTHSKTASLMGISRDQAKIFNYGRIYGAGKTFAQRLLLQFNPQLTPDEARRRVSAMYLATKGKKMKIYKAERATDEPTLVREEWQGGSESHMFNKLEKIALCEYPKTPVLGCRISRTLEPGHVSTNFMTSRINWAVQSSAVDYLHLMLVSMRWLKERYGLSTRFSISIHDEVRYLVASEDRWRTALALQLTNLMTRSMFAYQLHMNDLPQSVAFFSAVDVDCCLRKEVHLDCVTPSNPDGLHKGYGIPPGEAVNIYEILEKTNGSLDPGKQSKATDQPLNLNV